MTTNAIILNRQASVLNWAPCLHQVTGQPSVLYYATAMFQRAGIAMGQQATGIAGILGAFKLACTCECSARRVQQADLKVTTGVQALLNQSWYSSHGTRCTNGHVCNKQPSTSSLLPYCGRHSLQASSA